jgi:hypothetical protein
MSRMAAHTAMALRAAWFGRVGFVATVVVAALIEFAVLAVFAVLEIDTGDGPYASGLLQQPALRRGLLIGLALLVVPLVVLVGQCSQLAAPARDRRLASYRLVGGTPKEVRWIAAAEAVAPAVLGVLIGTSLFIAAQHMLDGPLTVWGSYTTESVTRNGPDATTVVVRVHEGWVRLAPTDVRVGPLRIIGSWILIPLAAVAAGWVAFRRVRVTPLSVVRRKAADAPPGSRAVVLMLLGLGGLMGFSLIRSMLGQPGHATRVDVIVVVALFALAAGGLIIGAASLSAQAGRWVANSTGRPSLLVAGRRLETDPFAASRTLSLIVVALVVAVSGQAVKAHFLVITDPGDPLYADSLRLVDVAYFVALVMALLGIVLRGLEGLATGRQQFALQVASGVPLRTLRRSLVLETIIPLVPTAFLAAAIAILGTRGVLGNGHSRMVGSGVGAEAVIVPIPIPWTQTATLVAVVLILATALSSLTFTIAARQLGTEDLRVSN